jgi:hypothetical protein
MSANHLTATPITPATASGSTFTFPILGGRVNKKLHGFVTHRGGLAFSNGTRTIRLRHLTVDSNRAGVPLWALVPQSKRRCRVAAVAPHLRCHLALLDKAARIARLSGVSVNVSDDTATGTVHLTPISAGVINRLSASRWSRPGRRSAPPRSPPPSARCRRHLEDQGRASRTRCGRRAGDR